jgi:polyisoprenoid-binding protein YceI
MRKKAFLLGLVLAVAAVCAAPAAAQKRAFNFDKAHSEINFIAEARFLTAHGFFGAFEGDVQINPDDWTDSSISFTIDAASINTRNDRRDNHLRSADFFDVANHPKITFTSTKITKNSDTNLTVTGELTIRGVTKTVEVPVRVVFFQGARGRFKGQFQINRKEYNINYNSAMNPIDDIVAVNFDFNLLDSSAQRQPGKQPPKAPQP